MSLSGYLPPVAENKSLLVDGGYMNVVPADVMAEFGAKTIIAVDVANENVAGKINIILLSKCCYHLFAPCHCF